MSGPNRERHLDGPSAWGKHEHRVNGTPMAADRTVSGAQALTEATGDASYDELGEPLKASITHKEWLWLSDMEKARLLQTMTEPEVFDDGV